MTDPWADIRKYHDNKELMESRNIEDFKAIDRLLADADALPEYLRAP